jgi:hypothetical protein
MSESEVVPACRGAGAFLGNRALLAMSSSVAGVIEATRHRRRVVQPAGVCECVCVGGGSACVSLCGYRLHSTVQPPKQNKSEAEVNIMYVPRS